jgi:hypothetical protein
MPLRISVNWGKPDEPVSTGNGQPVATGDGREVLYDVVTQRLFEQMERNDSQEVKVLAAFAFGSTVLPIAFSLLSLTDGSRDRCYLVDWFVGAATVLFGIVVALIIWALNIRTFSLRPDLDTLERYSQEYDKDVLQQWVAREVRMSIAYNEIKLQRKARLIGFATVFTLVEAVLLCGAALLAIFA